MAMLIGLCGRPLSGKSEVRFILEQQFGFEAVNTKLPIAKACSELTGIQLNKFLTQEGKASLYKDIPLREVMGKVQDTIEALFGDYQTIETALKGYDITNGKLVVDALRKSQPLSFPGYVVKVLSNQSIDTGNEFDLWDDSRTDFTLHNNGNFGNLEKEVSRMLDYFKAL